MEGKILSFTNTGKKIAYNPTIPFETESKNYIAVRVESLNGELDSRTFFAFEKAPHLWEIDYSLGSLPLEDPVYVEINGEIFLLGVKAKIVKGNLIFSQEFYRGDSIKDLRYFTSGPIGMKDIRLVDLEERIGVFTRPQGGIFGKGKIGYLEVNEIDELERFSNKDWYNATILEDLFGSEEWGGVNQAMKLSATEIGVIGHKAHFTFDDEGRAIRHYSGISFIYNPKKNKVHGFETIVRRENFPNSLSKKSPELDDVVFPAGLSRDNFYCGVSDACVGAIENLKLF